MKFKFITHSIQPEQKAQLRVHLPERLVLPPPVARPLRGIPRQGAGTQ
jgi:hypothetical protein